ncbi:hypothetical protein BV25DRAFT_1832938 [Artomyces pyxidatus]|uniref:Uncharacterized protein n=1 Tax=Artomyces pyxidatus TaxID=48021 RepID=A0ACB8SH00_9AGAM|nr:hypothetical protein BV25DRAFT_1832938 [Artomyces pyxidatus]
MKVRARSSCTGDKVGFPFRSASPSDTVLCTAAEGCSHLFRPFSSDKGGRPHEAASRSGPRR